MPKGIDNPTTALEKMCRGPLHRDGVWKPKTEFRFLKKRGYFFSECRECERYRKAHRHKRPYKVFGYAYYERYAWVFIEIVRRIGKREACRRIPMSYNTLWKTSTGRQRKIQKETVRRALLLLQELRASGEVRHKDSIAHGSYLRGRPEKIPTARKDFYVKHGDDDTERRRVYRGSLEDE